MSPRRYPPIGRKTAALGLVCIGLAVAAVVALSYALALPALEVPELRAPQQPQPERRHPGEVICPEAPIAQATLVTSVELIECPAAYEGRTIRYQGEAVGLVLPRQDIAWVHLNDDPYGVIGPASRYRTVVGGNSGMAVTIPIALADEVTAGGHNVRGTRLAITGTFESADIAAGGEPAIRATTVEVIDPAERFEEALSPRRVVAATVIALLAVVLSARLFVVRRRR